MLCVVSVSRFRWSFGGDGCRAYNDEPNHALLLQRDTSTTAGSQRKEPVWSVSVVDVIPVRTAETEQQFMNITNTDYLPKLRLGIPHVVDYFREPDFLLSQFHQT